MSEKTSDIPLHKAAQIVAQELLKMRKERELVYELVIPKSQTHHIDIPLDVFVSSKFTPNWIHYNKVDRLKAELATAHRDARPPVKSITLWKGEAGELYIIAESDEATNILGAWLQEKMKADGDNKPQALVDLDLLMQLIKVCDSAICNAAELRDDHDSRLGRTTPKNESIGKTLDTDYEMAKDAYNKLKSLLGK